MKSFVNFIYYNIFVYIIYMVIDMLFDLLNLYSNHDLGKDIMIMPTSGDMVLIVINIVVSMVLGLIALRKVNEWRDNSASF